MQVLYHCLVCFLRDGRDERLAECRDQIELSSTTTAPCWFERSVVAAAYVLGLVFWVVFFWDPSASGWARFSAADWGLSANFNAILRQAIAERTIPYLTDYIQYTDRFLGLPVAPLSPQFVLLPWLSDIQFLLLNHILMFTLFVWGLLAIRREYGLSLLSFLWLYVLFGFNGYIVAHLSVGHTMWYGYFPLPFFCRLMLRLEEEPWGVRERIAMAVLLLFILLQGGFHTFAWCVFYLVIVAILRPRVGLVVLQTLFLACLLSACRILPSVAALHHMGRQYYYLGFSDPLEVIRAFTNLVEFTGVTDDVRWERNFYIGTAAFLVVAYYLVQPLFQRTAKTESYPFGIFHAANLVLLLLSMGWIGRMFSYIPLLQSQRVPTRLFTIPMLMWIVIAVIQMDKRLRIPAPGTPRLQLLLITLGFAVFDLATHMIKWRVAKIEAVCGAQNEHTLAKILPVTSCEDPGMCFYIACVWIGFIVSLLTTFYCIWRFKHVTRNTCK